MLVRSLLLIITALHFITAKAQDTSHPLSYENIDAFTDYVRDAMLKTNGRKLVLDQQEYTIGIDSSCFKMYYHNRLLSYSISIDSILLVVENIDLASVTDILLFEDNIQLYFEDQSLSVEIYKPLYRKYNYNVIELHCQKGDVNALFKKVYDMISHLRMEEKIITTSEAKSEWDAFHSLSRYEFYKKYPHSILAMEGRMLEEEHQQKIRFVNNFLWRYNFPVREVTTVGRLSTKMEGVFELMEHRERYKSYANLPYKEMVKHQRNFLIGLQTQNRYSNPDRFDDYSTNNLVTNVDFCLINTTNRSEALAVYNEIYSELMKNLGPQFIEANEGDEPRCFIRLMNETAIGETLENNFFNAYALYLSFHSFVYKKQQYYYVQLSY